jgi:hypothetical protein
MLVHTWSQSDDLLHERVQLDVRQFQLRLACAVEFTHARHCLGHIVDGTLDGDQAISCSGAQVGTCAARTIRSTTTSGSA